MATITGSAGNFVISIGSVVILARLLTPADFGIVTMVTTFSLLLRSFGVNGFTELIIQREQVTETLASNLFWINVAAGIVLTIAFASSGRLLSYIFHNAAVVHVTLGIALTIAVGSVGYIHTALLQRAMHFRTIAIINFVGQIVQFVAAIALALKGWHYWALVWGSVAQTAAITIGAWIACRWIPGRPTRASETSGGVKFALNVYSHFAFLYLTRNTDNFLVGWRFGARALGLYKKAYDLFVLPETQLMAPVTAVVVGTLSRVSKDREKYISYFLRMMSLLALVGMGIGADFTLIGADIIRFLFGPGWEEAGRIFTIFSPAIGVGLLYLTHGWLHLSIGRPERWFRWGVFDFACTAGLFLVGLRWGPPGVASAWTVSYFLLLLPGLWYAGKPIELGIGRMVSTIWKYFAASVGAGLMTALVVKFVSFPTANNAAGAFARIVSVSVVFWGLYLAGIILLYRGLSPLTQTFGLLRELLPHKASSPTEAGGVIAQPELASAVSGDDGD